MREVPYSKAIAKKYPEQVVFAVSMDAAGRPNIIVLGWAMPTSGLPPMWAISVGHPRYSHQTISESGEFVLCFPNSGMVKQMLVCGTKSGRDIDKIKETGLKTQPAKWVKPPLIAGCLACFECKVKGSLVTGDHTVFAAEVLASYIEEDAALKRLYNWGDGGFAAASPEK